jgi:hypothetical protein
MNGEEKERLSLAQAAEYLLEECRMVLPGIQGLVGFQLIAVFNDGFDKKLSPFETKLHLASLVLVAIAIALVMTPAAYHRQTGPREVTDRFIRVSSALLLGSMFPLMLGLCIDVYLLGRIITDSLVAGFTAAGLFGVFVYLWLILPRLHRR